MRIPPHLVFSWLALAALAAGCHSSQTSRQRYRETPGSYSDQSARSAYIDRRVNELAKNGVSREEAAARASREWFTITPASSETPTHAELERRRAQADFEAKLDEQLEAQRTR